MNFIIYLVNEGLSKVLPFVTILIVAKYIDVESFGQLTVYFITFELLIILISNNITATTRIDYFKLDYDEYVKSKSIHLVVSLIIFCAVLIIGIFINSISYIFLVLLAVSSFLRTVSYYNLSNLQCKEDAKSYGISNFIYLISMNGLFVLMIILDYGINSWFYGVLFGAVMQFFYSTIHIKKSSLLIYDRAIIFNAKNLYKEFKYGLIFIPQAIGFWIKLGIDRILLNNFTSTLIVGIYMFAFQLSLPILILSVAINLYTTPKINQFLESQDYNQIKNLLKKFSLMIIVFTILTYTLSHFTIVQFYFEKYEKSLAYLPYIIISLSVQSIMMIYLNVFYYINQKEFVSKFIFVTSLLQLFIAFSIVKYFSIGALLIFNIVFNINLLIFILFRFNRYLIHNE